MAVALEQFVKQIKDSGVLDLDVLQDFLPPHGKARGVEELARELVKQKKLTRFQAEEIYRGKAKSLVIGNYILLEKIGAGGMGQVYKARHRRMDRIVAVKVLPASVARNKKAIARFEREAKAVSRISHPNIVAAHDADQAGLVHFLVMEYVDGKDLSVLVRKAGPLAVEQAVEYIVQAARGLAAAHAEGIVHRDIKPANLLVDKKGVVKILDLGLARMEGDTAAQAELTAAGIALGTVDYMAPEQALNTKQADARADIYGLGCTLFFLLANRPPYEEETLAARIWAHQSQPMPSLRSIRPDIPEQVEAVFQKMVAKKVDDRYQTMHEVIADFERCGTRYEPPVSMQAMTSLGDAGLPNFVEDFTFALNDPAPAVATPASTPSRRDRKQPLLIGAAVLGGLILLAGLILMLRPKQGTLLVTLPESDCQVQVSNDKGHTETSTAAKGKREVSLQLSPGKHELHVKKQGFEPFAKTVEIRAGTTETIAARLVPVKPKPPKPAVVKHRDPDPDSPFKEWLSDVAALPADKQVLAVTEKLRRLNPSYYGTPTSKIEDGVVIEFQIITDDVTDISPVQALTGLKKLECAGSRRGAGHLFDLSPLSVLRLQSMNCSNTEVADLSPLKEMPLTYLNCWGTKVTDLEPLRNMPLEAMTCGETRVSDLSPLSGKLFTYLIFDKTAVSSLAPLKGMPLRIVSFKGTPVTDLSPLEETLLQELSYDLDRDRDINVLRAIRSLKTINGKPAAKLLEDGDAPHTSNNN